MKKYFILSYLLLFRYKLYQHFFNLILLKLKNIFTFIKLKKEKVMKMINLSKNV